MGPQIGFTLQQLMELAGFSVAQAVGRQFPLRGKTETEKGKQYLLLLGQVTMAGMASCAARHLKLFGYNPVVFYPREASALNSTNSWSPIEFFQSSCPVSR